MLSFWGMSALEELEKAVRRGRDVLVWFSWDYDSKELRFYSGLTIKHDFGGLTDFAEKVKELVKKYYGEPKYLSGSLREERYQANGVILYFSAFFGYLYVEIQPARYAKQQ